MKKTLFLLIGTALSAVSFAQPTCDTNAVQGSFGIVPEEFDDAIVNVPYSQTLNFKAPTNTSGIPGAPPGATIHSFKIVSVTGLPAGFTYQCDKPNCEGYVGGSSGCAELSGTATQTGNYSISITISANVTAPILGNQDIEQTFSNFTFTVQTDQTGDCAISIVEGTTPLCVDSTLQLTAVAEGGVWAITGNGATVSQSGLVTGTSDGNVIVTYGGGTSACAEEGTYLVAIKACESSTPPPPDTPTPPGGGPTPPPTTSAIGDLATSQNVLYPNPTKQFVTIQNNSDFIAYSLYDMNGRLIATEKLQNSQNTINVQSLNNGVYFVKLENLKGEKITHKLIIQN